MSLILWQLFTRPGGSAKTGTCATNSASAPGEYDPNALPSARWSGQCAGRCFGFFDHTGSTRSPAETRRRSSATTYQRMTLRHSVARVSTASFSTPKKLCAANGPQAPLNGSLPPSIQSSCLADAFTDFAKASACEAGDTTQESLRCSITSTGAVCSTSRSMLVSDL